MAGARRALLWFWAPVLVALAVGAGVLQWLGPLPAAHGPAAPAAPTPAAAPPAASPAAPAAPVAATPAALSPASPPVASAPVPTAPVPVSGVIAAPDPALLEPSPAYPGAMLPRIAADGRMAMHVYAATPPAAAGRPVVAVLLAGIGLSAADSLAAIHALPGAVSLAVSPYAAVPAPAPLAAAPAPPASLAEVLAAARAAGHELFVSIPMEPQNYPLNDAGDHALLTTSPVAANAPRLEWALSRIEGYVGATGALGALRGERFAAAPEQMGPLMATLGARGLLYVDPRPGARPGYGREADLVIGAAAGRADIEARLARLEQMARDHGAALGLASAPDPVLVARLAAWTATLAGRGIVLVPVSAVAGGK